jgi:hypothetical protein
MNSRIAACATKSIKPRSSHPILEAIHLIFHSPCQNYQPNKILFLNHPRNMQVSTVLSLLALAIGSIRATPTPGVAQTAAALNAIELSSSDGVAAAASSVWLVMCIDADFKGSCVYGNNPRGKCRTSFAFLLLLHLSLSFWFDN